MILYEYEEILHQGLLKEAVSEALPHLSSISNLSLPYLADDRYILLFNFGLGILFHNEWSKRVKHKQLINFVVVVSAIVNNQK